MKVKSLQPFTTVNNGLVSILSGLCYNFLFIFSATFISTEEKVGVKLEDPNNKVCFSPQEVQVYEDLQKSKYISSYFFLYFFIHIRSIKTYFSSQEHQTFWTRGLQTLLVMDIIMAKGH